MIFQKDINESIETDLNSLKGNVIGIRKFSGRSTVDLYPLLSFFKQRAADINLRSYISFRNFVNLLFCILFFLPNSNAQIRKELEDRRRQLLSDIRVTSDLLDKTAQDKAAALDRFVTLQKQTQKRVELIETLREEIAFTDRSMERASEVIDALTKDIEKLKSEYSALMREAYRQKKSSSNFTYLFSSKSLNQVFKRWQYLKQYDQYRKRQAQLIQQTQQMLSNKKNQLEEAKEEKVKLLASSERQAQILSIELGDKSRILKTLKKDESRLKRELRTQRKDHERLNQAIESTIKDEIAVRRKRERNNQPLNTKPSSPDDPAALNRLTGNFKSNRGRLSMPVDNGIITKRFGQQPHPTLPRIKITNNGIDIRTDRNADVKAVFEGKVISKQYIAGYQNMLIVQHGEYYTVYSNLETVDVEKGEQVGTLQTIGKVSVDRRSNVSVVHFEVWRDKVRLNPEDWVK